MQKCSFFLFFKTVIKVLVTMFPKCNTGSLSFCQLTSGVDPDPMDTFDFGRWNPDPGRPKLQQKMKIGINVLFRSDECSRLRTDCFSYSLGRPSWRLKDEGNIVFFDQ